MPHVAARERFAALHVALDDRCDAPHDAPRDRCAARRVVLHAVPYRTLVRLVLERLVLERLAVLEPQHMATIIDAEESFDPNQRRWSNSIKNTMLGLCALRFGGLSTSRLTIGAQ